MSRVGLITRHPIWTITFLRASTYSYGEKVSKSLPKKKEKLGDVITFSNSLLDGKTKFAGSTSYVVKEHFHNFNYSNTKIMVPLSQTLDNKHDVGMILCWHNCCNCNVCYQKLNTKEPFCLIILRYRSEQFYLCMTYLLCKRALCLSLPRCVMKQNYATIAAFQMFPNTIQSILIH